MFKVERKSQKADWYEVMLSPFNTLSEALKYIEKYSKYYPNEEKNYRILNSN